METKSCPWKWPDDKNAFNFLASLINGNDILSQYSVVTIAIITFNFLASLINGNQSWPWNWSDDKNAFNFLASLINGNNFIV